MGWTPLPAGTQGIITHNFIPSDGEYQIAVDVGDLVEIQEECEGWYRGYLPYKKKVRGIFPANHVHLKSNKKGEQGHDPLLNETDSILREWGATLKTQLWEQKYADFDLTKEYINYLLGTFRQLLAQSLSEDGLKKLKKETYAKISEGNRLFGLDIFARNELGVVMDDKNSTVIEIYNKYKEMEAQVKAEKETGEKNIAQVHHMFFDLKACIAQICGPGETSELYFGLYNRHEKQWISENFIVELTTHGMPKDENKIGKLRTMFVDLSGTNLVQNIYLVCRIVRNGRMNPNDKEKNSQAIRRPFGCAVQDVSEILSGKEKNPDKEYTMPIYVASSEETFSSLHENIIEKNSAGYQTVATAQAICVSMRMFHGEITTIQKENPTLLKDTPITEKMGFPDIIMPGLVRNVLYVNLLEGEFQKGRKTAPKNVEIAISVKSNSGEDLPGCVSRACGEPNLSEFESIVLYHSNAPKFGETIRLDIPIDKYGKSHLFFSFRHCSSNDSKDKLDKNFAFGFVNLVEADGTVLSDSLHNLTIYQWDKKLCSNASYLTESDPKKLIPTKDTFSFKSALFSTKLTQKKELLSLLRWKSSTGSEMSTILKNFTFIGEVEIIKFVQDIFDALFSILDSDKNKDQSLDSLVFSALVFILGIITDKRFTHFRPVLDAYIEMHFSGAMAHKHLITSLKKCLSNPLDSSMQKELRSAMKTLEYIFKFIIQSRVLQRNQDKRSPNAPKIEEAFKQHLFSLFEDFNNMMSKTEPTLIGAQTLTLQNFSSIFKELSKVFELKDLVTVAVSFIGSVNTHNPKVTVEKLKMIKGLVNSVLFENNESRSVLAPAVIKQVDQHLKVEDKETLSPALSILTDVINSMQRSSDTGEASYSVLTMLPRLLSAETTLINEGETESQRENRNGVAATIIATLYSTPPQHLDKFIEAQKKVGLLQFLSHLISVGTSLMRSMPFPKQWSSMNLIMCKTVVKILTVLKPLLLSDFLKTPINFNQQLWSEYFNLIISLLISEHLQLELFSPSKEKEILNSFGDLRIDAIDILKTSWAALGDDQIRFVPSLVGPFVELSMSLHQDLRTISTDILFLMIEKEFSGKKNLDVIELECIDKLDRAVHVGDEDYRTFFVSTFDKKLKEAGGELLVVGTQFLKSMDHLLELVLSVKNLPEGGEYEDERTLGITKLMEFIKKTNRQEAIFRYAQQLADIHLKSNNTTEAAFALSYLADQFEWSAEKMLPPQGKFPRQTSLARKELLYNQIIDLFTVSKNWEYAAAKCRELAQVYRDTTFEYIKLGEILKKEASLVVQIATQERYSREYFRVGFYGFGFPQTLRNKQFIYRGEELERISNFCERIQEKHPNSELMKTNAPPGDDILKSPKQYIQIVKVDPEPDLTHPKLAQRVPEELRKYYETNDINKFSFSRPYKKQKTGNEFLDLWTQKTVLTCKDKFPSLLRRAEVVDSQVLDLAPIENALISMKNKNKELETFEVKYKQNKTQNANPFTMALNGVVDAPVNGGVAMYRVSFFSEGYAKENPAHQEMIKQLQEEIDRQVKVVANCIVLHGEIVPENMLPLHGKIIENFEKNFKDEIARLIPNFKAQINSPSSAMNIPTTPIISNTPTSTTSPIIQNTITRSPSEPENVSLASNSNTNLPPPPTTEKPPISEKSSLPNLPNLPPPNYVNLPPPITNSPSSIDRPKLPQLPNLPPPPIGQKPPMPGAVMMPGVGGPPPVNFSRKPSNPNLLDDSK